MGDSFADAQYRLTIGCAYLSCSAPIGQDHLAMVQRKSPRRVSHRPGAAPVVLGYQRSLRILYLPASSRFKPCILSQKNEDSRHDQQKILTGCVLFASSFVHRFPVFVRSFPLKSSFSGKRNGNLCDYMKLAIAGRSRCYQGAVFIRSLIQVCNPKAVRVFWLYYMIQHRESRTFSCRFILLYQVFVWFLCVEKR